MKRSRLCLLFLAVLLCGYVKAQSHDELTIPIETDNQFPPDNHSENDNVVIEGSGEGVVEDPTLHTTTEFSASPELEEVEAKAHNEVISSTDNATPCPTPCVCNTEGEEFVVDCAGYGLTEFPSPIDPSTTKLNIQKNKITEIPKQVSSLKNLKELNANDNLIMELTSGSVSELPELVVLKLANNRLIEYPKDLKNSLSLTKLEELDLGGNDMRTALSPDVFSGFSKLRKVTLATSTPELLQDICGRLKENLESVCTGSCDKESYDCPDAPEKIDHEMFNVVLPAIIPHPGDTEEEEKEDADPSLNIPTDSKSNKGESANVSPLTSLTELTTSAPVNEKVALTNEFSLRSKISNAPADVAPSNTIVDAPKEVEPTTTEGDVKIGAKTSDTKSGGVDRSIIAIIVAGMVVIVAGVTIKKNWSSIKKRFSSTPRPPNERPGGNANGTSPEEIPLQDKSPV
ncbi:uncharacterized protein [Epargyreus clarus]|uniref:uncharacterized protein n=1 Tax=Epargyreus clarus TaxID=520877 RepID=UPI003C2ABF86